jgi:hypothetical protein
MKNFKLLTVLLSTALLIQSCATLLDGEIQPSQKQKPETGEPKRKMKVFPLVVGIVTLPTGFGLVSLIVDFSTRAIYKPTEKKID